MTTTDPVSSPSSARAQSPLAPPMLALEDAAALDPVVAAADGLAGAVVADDRVRGLLQGDWLGHAVHPLLIEVPMGNVAELIAPRDPFHNRYEKAYETPASQRSHREQRELVQTS